MSFIFYKLNGSKIYLFLNSLVSFLKQNKLRHINVNSRIMAKLNDVTIAETNVIKAIVAKNKKINLKTKPILHADKRYIYNTINS